MPLYVYFHIYNLVRDMQGEASYTTECILLPEGESKADRGSIVYKKKNTTREDNTAEFYPIDVHSVDAGRYTLLVRVTDKKRVFTVTASREVEILKGE